MGHDRYDVIIVGASPAGSSAAKICADNNLTVALIERGRFPGTKNMFGGTIYRAATEEIIPNFWEEAPIERNVIREVLYFMETDSVVEIGFTSFKFAKPPYNTFTVILCRLKEHPTIKRLVEGGKTVQYMGKIIPNGGYNRIPELYDDGVIIIGDAGMLVSGRHGTDTAMLSGKYAAETVIQAKSKGDFSKKTLSSYQNKINNTFFLNNMKINRKSNNYYKKHPDADFLISKTLNKLVYEFFIEGNLSQEEKFKIMLEKLQDVQALDKSLNDFYHALMNWRIY